MHPIPDTWDDVASWLRERRVEQGMPTYRELVRRVRDLRVARGLDASEAPGRATVYDCFRDGRKRMDIALVADLAQALGLTVEEARQFEQACFSVQNRIESARVVAVIEQLPQTPYFVGRRRELADIAAAPTGPWLIAGLPGTGKTQLALRAAQAMLHAGVARRLLVADMRGFDRSRPPADGDAMLDELIRTLTGSLASRPNPLAERQRLLREALSEQRVVLIVDDASSTDQVMTVLGEEPWETPLIATSRGRLDVTAAHHVLLDGLSPEEGLELLGAVLPPGRMEDEQAAAREIVARTAGHPLALDLAAGQIAASGWSLADHAHRLSVQATRLRLPHSIEEQLDLSVGSLSPSAQRVLRAMAVTPCSELATDAVGVLVGDDRVAAPLEELVAANLVMRRGDRHSLHDLVRLFACQLAEELDSASQRTAAVDRLVAHYVVRVRQMVTALGAGARPRVAPDRFEQLPSEITATEAAAWFVAERENLMVLAGHEDASPDDVYLIARSVANRFDTVGWYGDAALLLQRAFDLARQHDDARTAAEAGALLGSPLGRMSDPRAEEVLQAALTNPAIDPYARINALTAMVLFENRKGSVQRALDYALDALALVESGEVDRPRANLLGNVAALLGRQDRLDESVVYNDRAYEAALAEGDQVMAAIAVANVSPVLRELGELDRSVEAAREAIRIAESEQFDMVLVSARSNLGLALARLGRVDEAIASHTHAIEGCRRIGDRDQEPACVNDLVDTYLTTGRVEEARALLAEALPLAMEIADPNEVGRSHEFLGRIAQLGGETDTARIHFDQAVESFASAGFDADVERVRERLVELSVAEA